VLWGALSIVFFTAPIQPYADGTWGTFALAALGGLGVLAAVVGRGAAAVVGTILGFAAAVAIQLFVLAGQAVANPGVVAGVTEPPWSGRVAIALAIGVGAILGGWLLAAAVREVVERRRGERTTSSGALGRILTVAGVVIAAIVLVGALVANVATSAYVVPSDQPVVALEVVGDEIVSAAPSGVRAGRMELEVRRSVDGVGDVAITSALTPDDLATLGSDRMSYDWIGEVFIGGSTGIRQERRHVQLETPGSYAFIVWDALQEPDAAGSVTLLDSQRFEVLAPAAGTPTASGDGGSVVRLGGLLGVLVGVWSAGGCVLMARRRRWIDAGRPSSGDLRVAAVAGTVAGLLLGGLALFAIDLARNPF
jgi:hypothetical protein